MFPYMERLVFPQAMVAWQYVQSVMGELGRRDGELQLEEKAFLLLFAAVGLQLLAEPATTTETVEVSACENMCV